MRKIKEKKKGYQIVKDRKVLMFKNHRTASTTQRKGVRKSRKFSGNCAVFTWGEHRTLCLPDESICDVGDI